MPVRRRIDRRRLDDLQAWGCYFESGYDWFGHLVDARIVADSRNVPVPRALALAAWRRLGAAFMLQYEAEQASAKHPHLDPPWALEEFGLPTRNRRYVA